MRHSSYFAGVTGAPPTEIHVFEKVLGRLKQPSLETAVLSAIPQTKHAKKVLKRILAVKPLGQDVSDLKEFSLMDYTIESIDIASYIHLGILKQLRTRSIRRSEALKTASGKVRRCKLLSMLQGEIAR